LARPLWSGAIRFGMVNIPVQLFTAVREHDVRFHQLHEKDGGRIRYKRVCDVDGEEVPYEDIVKGFEITKGEYVTMKADELENLMVPGSRAIDIEDFVRLQEIDPVYFAATYHLVPDEVAAPAYALLSEAMKREGRVALGRVVMRSREHPCAIRPAGEGLVLNLLHHADELVRAPGAVATSTKALPPPGAKELTMAQQLIDSLASDFQPEEIVSHVPAAERPGKVIDLMAALEQSLAGRRKGRGAAPESGAKTEAKGESKREARGEKRAPQQKAARKSRSSK